MSDNKYGLNMDNIENDLNEYAYNISESNNIPIKNIRKFLKKYRVLKNPLDNKIIKKNIITVEPNGAYNIPDKAIYEFFELLNQIKFRRIIIAERQLKYSGIMIDIDIYQTNDDSQITNDNIKVFFKKIIKILLNLLEIDDIDPSNNIRGTRNNKYMIIMGGITQKPEIEFISNNNCYKDGFHVLIPSIKITRGLKKIFIKQIIEQGILSDVFKHIKGYNVKSIDEFIDKSSSSNPVMFVEFPSKKNKPAYVLSYIYQIVFNKTEPIQSDYINLDNITEKFKSNCNNIFNEFSLNWESEQKLINKYEYLSNKLYRKKEEEINNKIIKYKNNKSKTNLNGNLSTDTFKDPELFELQKLLNILDIKRSDDYNTWWNILVILKNTHPKSKDLGEEFSRKSNKFNINEFNQIWNDIKINKENPLTIATLHYYAKIDNPIEYKKLRDSCLSRKAFELVLGNNKQGKLGHYDIAKLLHILLKNKFVTSDSNFKSLIWYEFMFPNDTDCKNGEAYKWKEHLYMPSIISQYLSEDNKGIKYILEQVLNYIKENYIEKADNNEKKYYEKTLNNLITTFYNLSLHNWKYGVESEAKILFKNSNFSMKLNKNKTILGVGNGVLQLYPLKLYQEYHSFLITRYTKVNYIPFDPINNVMIKRLLIGLRTMFPNHECDTFEFIMHYFASSLDAKDKPPMILFLVGGGSNGKSTLLEIVKAALDTYAVKINISFLTEKNSGSESATPQKMMLKDARLAYASESNPNEVLNGAKMKEITGNETITGRFLNQDCEEFTPHCIYLVLSNSALTVSGQDYATWRRIKMCRMKHQFKLKHQLNKFSKTEFEADESFLELKHDKNALEAMLAILTYYYNSLQKKYNGNVLNIPHPNIEYETKMYKYSQNRLEIFLDKYAVIKKNKSDEEDDTYITPFSSIKNKYMKWFNSEFSNLNFKSNTFYELLEQSKLEKYIIRDDEYNSYVKYVRILNLGESMAEDECRLSTSFSKSKINYDDFKSETPDEFYNNICKNYKYILNNENNV